MSDEDSRGRADRWAVGMALVRPSRDLQAESYSQELIAGLDEAITRAGGTFIVKVVPDEAAERATYQQWAEDGRIRSVVIEELTITDTRRPLLEEYGLEVTVLGDRVFAGDWPVIWNDHAAAMKLAMDAMQDLGHRSVARVSGPLHFHHSAARSSAFFALGAARALVVTEAVGDYSRQSGVKAVRELFNVEEPPTAIIFDNDLMALGGLAEITGRGLRVPEDVSIVAWDDSVRCQMSIPPLAALSHDVHEIGESAGEAASVARHGRVIRKESPRPIFLPRASVGPPRTR
ncbi:LacI family DNA-binding transcriptional regulator [Microbacterium sp. KSW4-11]|uniref:LacI family DNA-binding transcriptional regulator n=1 Tax=Microbacterium gawkjiense TaxID=3067309 RepID=A0ABU3G9A9_9MICO|nr:LacI family DNA-binding transcriptional regulator [Microbacterium sp. KSW4-11]MDT3316384.1 LacI family DNA-binding transcriptional regulator [Microbacterium sp. KSW4-11]